MKLLFAITKPQLTDALSEIIPKTEDANYAYTEPELEKGLNRWGTELDFLVVHEDVFSRKYPWEWMSYLRLSVSNSTKIIVILSDKTDSLYREIIKRLSIDLAISLIPFALTGQELSEEISNRLFTTKRSKEKSDNEFGRIVTILSAAPKDGATTIAISTAICMAQHIPDKKVLLLDLNLKSPEIRDHLHLTADKGYPLIQADCDSATLESGSLFKACEQLKGINNLYILTGIQRREWAEKITMEEIEHLLSIAKKSFDFVIADVHTYPDQAATLKCVKDADERLVIVQPIITSYQSSWNDWYNSVWQHYELEERDFHLVMNRDVKVALEGLQIEKGMGAKIISKVRNVDKGAGIKAINYGQPLYLNTGEEAIDFRNNILELTSWLAARSQMELMPMPNDSNSALRGKRSKIFSIFQKGGR
ncbi:MAG: CpaE family protein [Candidatus Pristimantibacillus sp.]